MDPNALNGELITLLGVPERPYSTEIGWALRAVEIWRSRGTDRFLSVQARTVNGKPEWMAVAYDTVIAGESRMVVSAAKPCRAPAEAVATVLVEVMGKATEVVGVAQKRRRGAA